MLKWMLLHDMRFHNPNGEWIVLKKGSIYTDVHHANQDREIVEAIKNKKRRSNYNTQFVVLDAEGLQRMFVIGQDVTRHISSSKRFKRIRRNPIDGKQRSNKNRPQ